MRLTFASYNIHKAVGLDRKRDPHRILAILNEVDADIVALQEADRRFGRRESVLPRDLLDDLGDYRAVPLTLRPDSIGRSVTSSGTDLGYGSSPQDSGL